jgi:guanylate kinase
MSAARIRRRGLLFVLCSPSGVGKTTIARRLVEEDPALTLSVSVTTRPQRPGEVDGRDYRFIERSRFDAMVTGGELLEHALVFDNHYGTPRQQVEEALATGRDMVGDVDWQGTRQLAASIAGDLVSVFLLPPSIAALKARLRARAQDSTSVVAARMAKWPEELSHWPECNYVIVNDTVDNSVADARAIITAERLRRERQVGLTDFVNRLRAGGSA